MKTFLAIVGGLCIAFAFGLLILFAWLRWKIRRMAEKIGSSIEEAMEAAQKSSVPPFRIKLASVAALEWQSPEEIEKRAAVLREAQFREAGTFIGEPANLRLAAFCHPEESAYAVIYEGPGGKTWMDLATYYEDGSSVTYTTVRDTLLDRPDNKLIRFFEGFGAEELLRTFLRERPRMPMLPITPAEFAERFERAYAEGMDFRIAQGGPTEAEIRRIADRSERECTPEIVGSIRSKWTEAIERFRAGEVGGQ